jgi:hypothetical protein
MMVGNAKRQRLSRLAETLARLALEAAHDGAAAAEAGDAHKAAAWLAESAAYLLASRSARAARDELIGLAELSVELAYREAGASQRGLGCAAEAYSVARSALAREVLS